MQPERIAAQAILTPRLRLDPLTVGDADEMFVVYADQRMYEFTGGEPPTADALRRRYELLSSERSADGTESWLNWVVRPTGHGSTVVGAMQATVVHQSGEAWIAWEIGVPWQGRGYAGEAAVALVEWLHDRSVGPVGAYIHPDHVASERVARRAGLRPTDVMHDGETVWLAAPA